MKILMLTDSMEVGGAETHVATLCRYLLRRGHEVFLLSGGGDMSGMVREAGGVCLDARFRDRSAAGVALSLADILSAVRLVKPHVIHAHGRFVAFLADGVSSFFCIPLVVTSHADPTQRRLPPFLSPIGHRCIAVSCDIKMKLERYYGVESDRICVIPNGIDTERFDYCYKSGRGIKKIVFVSRLDRDCSQVARRLIGLSFLLRKRLGVGEIVIVGGGEEYDCLKKLEAEVRKKHGECGVRFTSSLSDVREELCDASLFIGVSRAAMEAMSMGIPVILAGDEGMLGLCTSGVLALAERTNLCCRGESAPSAKSLYDEIKRFSFMSPEERARLSVSLRRYIEEKRSDDVMGSDTERIYREVYAEARGRRMRGGRSCLLCGYYGYGNMGDDALLKGAIKRAAREGYRDVRALTRRGRRDEKRYGISCIGRYSPVGVIRGIKSTDTLIFGGGTLLQNRTSDRSLAYYLALERIGLFFKKPWEMWGGGIGELTGGRAKKGVSEALGRCRHIGVRDSESCRAARDLTNGKKRIFSEHDLSEKIEKCDSDYGEYFMRSYGIPERFVIVAPKSRERAELYRAIGERIRDAKKHGYGIVVCALFPRQDGELCRRIAERSGAVLVESISPEEYAYLASRAEYVVGMRLHSLIFAARYGKRCIPIGDDMKIRAFAERVGYSSLR